MKWYRCSALALVPVLLAGSGGLGVPSSSSKALDQVIASATPVAFKGPWLVWNKATCRFEPTSTHPNTYIAQLYKQTTPLRVVFTPEATTFPVDALINGGVLGAGKDAGVKVTLISNEAPSTTKPIQVAAEAVVQHPGVVLSANVFPQLYPQIQAKYEAACLPMINMFNFALPHPAPGFQSGFAHEGNVIGDAAVKVVRQRNWPTDQLWLYECGNPVFGLQPNTLNDVDRYWEAKMVAAFHVPQSRISGIQACDTNGVAGVRASFLDWLTAHPQAHYVAAVVWADALANPLAQAFKQKGYGTRGMIATGDASGAVLQLIEQHDPQIAVDADKNFITWGIYGIGLAQDVMAHRPVPSYVDPGTFAVTADNAKQVLAARAKYLKDHGFNI